MSIQIKTLVLSILLMSFTQGFAGQPAARVGDNTSGGGVIVSGFPTVLINGKPAARATDLITTPLVVGFIPCVGGPIIKGSTTVRIGSIGAARQGDLASTICGPEKISGGSPNVLIGN